MRRWKMGRGGARMRDAILENVIDVDVRRNLGERHLYAGLAIHPRDMRL